MENSRMKLGWFNAWVGFIWIFLFIHSLYYFFDYENYLQRLNTPVIVSQAITDVERDSSEMLIVTDKGVFYHYNKDNFKKIEKLINNNQQIKIWYGKDDKITADFKSNGDFLLRYNRLGVIIIIFSLILSGGMVILSTILVIKTKGWGTYELMEKHRKQK